MKDINILKKIAEALLIDYTSVYYIDAVTNEYQWFSVDPNYHSLNLEQGGDDFFVNIVRDAKKSIYPEDLHIFLEDMQKEKLLQSLTSGEMQSIQYRLMIDGEPVWHTIRLLRGKDQDSDYFVIGVINIDRQVKEKLHNEQISREREEFNKIAQSLASHYDVIYYVNAQDGRYLRFNSGLDLGGLKLEEQGQDFFADARRNIKVVVHSDDLELVESTLSRDYLLNLLEDTRKHHVNYRLLIDGREQYTRMTILWSSDRVHFIIGVENVDAEIRREMEQEKQLSAARELARKDDLTGVKNKKAYLELAESVQQNIDSGLDYLPFAIAICDLNDLKAVNDTLGHNTGDDYIIASCAYICDIFDHSPVFRIGGDEFLIFVRGKDYEDRERLVSEFKAQIRKNIETKNGPVIAIGMAEFEQGVDFYVTDVFEKADILMYENKAELKKD